MDPDDDAVPGDPDFLPIEGRSAGARPDVLAVVALGGMLGASARYGIARAALVHEMPHTLAALGCGAPSEWRATLIARESACLDIEDRRRLDGELCADVNKLDGMGDARITAAAKEIAARLDAQAVVDRAAKAPAAAP